VCAAAGRVFFCVCADACGVFLALVLSSQIFCLFVELGDESRLAWINADNDAGWAIYHGLSQNSGVLLKSLCEWWQAEDNAIKLNHFIMKCFPGSLKCEFPFVRSPFTELTTYPISL
jgi:hypothetical protein